MNDYTTNIGLTLTSEDTDTSFKSWRLAMNGDTSSNMIKIDDKFGDVDTEFSTQATVQQGLSDELNALSVKVNEKIDIVGGDISKTLAEFERATTREDISSKDSMSTIVGKIKKWLDDLSPLAFSSKYSDLIDAPSTATNSANGFMAKEDKEKLDGIASGAQVNSVTGVKGDNDSSYCTGNINITKNNIGLGNVPNVTTNNQTPTYTEASTLTTLTSGETLATSFGKIKKCITALISHTNKTNDSSNSAALLNTDTNYPTVRAIYHGLPNINNSHSYTSTTSIYAPTTEGTAGYELVSNGNGAPVWKAPSYAYCDSHFTDNIKIVSIPNFVLTVGASVKIKFRWNNTAYGASLNINNTVAKQIYYNDSLASESNSWKANELVEFVYDGTCWRSIASSREQALYCSNQTDLDNAIKSLPASGGKIMLQSNINTYDLRGGRIIYESDGSYYYERSNIGAKSITFVGMGNLTRLRVEGRFSGHLSTDYPEEKYYNTLCFEDMDVAISDLAYGTYTNFNFDNCTIKDGGCSGDEMLHCQNSNICNCNIVITAPAEELNSCYTGFNVTRNIVINTCTVDLRCPEGLSNYEGLDYNLIYNAASGSISNSYIKCGGVTRTNIVHNGNVSMNNNSIILENDKATIAHYSDNTSPTASFVGNYVEYYNTYMRFATISGNTFNHKAVGTSSSNRILLLSSANITGNTFGGSTTTIDCQQHKSIISLNMSKSGLTVYNAPTGSVNINNITY